MNHRLPTLLIVCLALMLGPLSEAAARTIKVEIIRAQVRCVTEENNGEVKTRCSIIKLHRVGSDEIPGALKAPDLPPGLAELPAAPPEDGAASGRKQAPGTDSDHDLPAPPARVEEPRAPAPEAEPAAPAPVPPPRTAPAPPVKAAPAPGPEATPAAPVKAATPAPTPATRTVRMLAGEVQVMELLNKERARRGLGQLKLDAEAVKAARAHSRDMCARQFFDHTSPEGTKPWDRLRSAGASFSAAAENIAKGYTSAATVHQGWLDSPGHRTNRLNGKYTRIGVGLYLCNGKVPYWTELFMR